MKIYYASQSFYPHIGGVSTYLLNLCNEMVKRGNEVVEVHLRPAGELHEEEIKGIEIIRVPRDPIDKEIMRGYSKFKETVYKESHYKIDKFNDSPDLIEGYREYKTVNEYFGEELKNLLEENPADVVHIHDFQLLFAYKYVPRGTPLILTWHIPFIKNMSKPMLDFLLKHMKEYDKIVFSSEDYIKAAVKAGLPEEKAELIYPIANTEVFKRLDIDRKEVLKKFKIPEDSRVILCVQRVDPKSGHEQLIKAMPDVLKKIPDAKLVFVGGDSLSNKLSKSRAKLKEDIMNLITKLKLEKNVIFTGTIDYYKLPELYNACDIVALCSKNEGFGLSVTEGMACGNPIVGTKVGGIPIQVKDGYNGFLVDVGDHKTTAEKITELLMDDKLRQQMTENSLSVVDENFKIERGVEKHLMLYNKVIKIKDEFHKLEYFNISDFKGLITDFDRTLYNNPEDTDFDSAKFDRDLLKQLKKLDLDLFLATSRSIKFVKKLTKKFNIWRCVIAENGAVLYFPNTKKTITFNTYHMKRVKKMVRNMQLPNTTIGKITVVTPIENEEKIRAGIGKLSEKVKFYRNVNDLIIVPDGVDKGVGLKLAMLYLNIDMEKTIIVGDGENDVDMFLNPGFKIAMSNSSEKLKKLANQITDSSSIDGMKEIIKKLKM